MRTKYTKPQTPIDTEFDDSEASGSESAETKNKAQHPTIGEAPHVVTDKEMETITNSVQFMADAYKGFTKMFCDDDGFLIDISDKAGREHDRQFMLSMQSRLDACVQRIEQDMQRHYKAEFPPKEAQLLETLNRNFDISRYWVFGSCFLGALFFFVGLALCISSSNRVERMEKQLEQQRNEQTETAAFGSYAREVAPNAYRAWKARLTAEKDSVKNENNAKGISNYEQIDE